MRPLARVLALILLVALFAMLVADFGSGSFTIHMIAHMGMVAVLAPLLAYGIVDTRLAIPSRMIGAGPFLASLLELLVVWVWHFPIIRVKADTSLALTILEQASFLIAGVLLWHVCLRPNEGRLFGAVGLLFTSMHMPLLGALLALAPRPLFGDGEVTCFGLTLSAAVDQQIGGFVMLMVGALAYLLGGVLLLSGALRGETASERRPRC